jgi:urease accessory protein
MPTPEKRLRLMQLASSNLPVGGYSWSQGLEWAVEAGWVPDAAAFERWQQQQMEQSFFTVDLPLFARLYRACETAICRSPAGPPICSPAGRPANCVKKSATAARRLPACWPTGSRTARRRGAAVPAKPARRHGVARRALANRTARPGAEPWLQLD